MSSIKMEENSPYHISNRTIQVIDVIEAWYLKFHIASVIKHIARADQSSCEREELEKALWYLNRFINIPVDEEKDYQFYPTYPLETPMSDDSEFVYIPKKFTVEEISKDWKLDKDLKKALNSLYENALLPSNASLKEAGEYIKNKIRNLTLNQQNKGN